MESRAVRPVGQQIYDQHKHRDELLACRGYKSLGDARAAVPHGRGAVADGTRDSLGTLRRARMGLRTTTPIFGVSRAPWTMPIRACGPTAGRGWAQHLWQHYLFTGDRDFLRRCYPVLKGTADFFLTALTEHPTYGWMVTAPSVSPEHGPQRRLDHGGAARWTTRYRSTR